MTFGFRFYSVLCGVGFNSVQVFAHFLLLGSGSVLGKTWVLVGFVLARFGLFPISSRNGTTKEATSNTTWKSQVRENLLSTQ